MEQEKLEELSQTPEKKEKAIIDIKEDWPMWQRVLASIVNAFPVFVWMFLTIGIMYYLSGNVELAGLRNAYLNLVVPAVAYGILSLNAGLALVSWFFPYFSIKRVMKSGTPLEKAGLMLFWGLIALSLGIIIASVA